MLPQKQWYDSSTADPEQVKQLCSEWKTNPLVAEILLRRGYKTHEEIKSFLMPSLSNLRDPYELRQMREAVISFAGDDCKKSAHCNFRRL